ncbi:hypothetical protein [Treponema sp.]|uniref:hypothetical protein n=1 Tax=Treponema sp. TaxID=166 RepID=UPI0025D7C24E|nr:hypothetical protein [Treponema sp.]MCR5217046.1 hypothetical protein [Treponema sp.]
MNVLVNALLHEGWGLGIKGEYLFTNYFSTQGRFEHTTFFSKSGSSICTTESIDLNLFYYPFASGLDKYLYLGAGESIKFIQFTNQESSQKESSTSAIFVLSQIGWRQPAGPYLSFEAYTGYRWQINTTEIPEEYNHLLNNGFIFGVKVNINFSRLISKIFS